jgi:hypothetical protein
MTFWFIPPERLAAAERTPMTCRERVLAAALWKLHKTAPLQITQADMEACRDSFAPEPWTLLILDTPDGVELRVTTGHDAHMRRAYAESQSGNA